MTLYLLEWWNGLDFDDRVVTLLGIYPSAEERNLAKVNYKTRGEWPVHNNDGEFIEFEAQLGQDLYPGK